MLLLPDKRQVKLRAFIVIITSVVLKPLYSIIAILAIVVTTTTTITTTSTSSENYHNNNIPPMLALLNLTLRYPASLHVAARPAQFRT